MALAADRHAEKRQQHQLGVPRSSAGEFISRGESASAGEIGEGIRADVAARKKTKPTVTTARE